MLHNMHWQREDFRERMPLALWEKILLAEGDRIVFEGNIRRMSAKRLSPHVVEVFKEKIAGDREMNIKFPSCSYEKTVRMCNTLPQGNSACDCYSVDAHKFGHVCAWLENGVCTRPGEETKKS